MDTERIRGVYVILVVQKPLSLRLSDQEADLIAIHPEGCIPLCHRLEIFGFDLFALIVICFFK
jgi:hypothetical protein